MNENQLKLKSILTNLVDGNNYYEIKPATKVQIELFTNRATENKVDPNVIKQLSDLYSVADSFDYEIIISFHSCDDLIIFEWWNDQELWLGQKDFNIIRWADGKFCLGDASNIAFSNEYQFDTLIELIEGCIKDIDEAKYFDKNKTNND